MPPTNSNRRRNFGAAASAALGLLLVGTVAVAPAQADSFRSQQWHLDAMKADQMWKTSTGKGITVAVVDTGVNADHPDLQGQVLPGKDLAKKATGDAHTDYDGHGTGIAGVIAGTGSGNGGNGAFGLAPRAKILPVRISNGERAANRGESSEWVFTEVAQGIRYAADHGAKVINVSHGAATVSPDQKPLTDQLADAVKYALGKGSLIFAATGNDGSTTNSVNYPAATPGVVGVGAISENGKRTSESNEASHVDVAAPGMDIVHACGGKTGYCKSHGTSDASALASASAALIWSKHPSWTNNQVLKVILNTIGGPTDGAKRNDSIGYGIVRPRIALTNPGNPGPADKFPMSDFPVVAKSPAPEASKATGSDEKPEAAAAAKDDGGNTGLWIGVGVAAVVVIGGAVAFVAARRRRGDQQVPPPPPGAPVQQGYPGGPYGAPQQQPYGGQQFTGQQPYGPGTPGGSPESNPYRGS
ncbi:type VII secretion-associated serine protease mycosin [Streptomyces longispororuber]|uniref:type VII secretion-associated serine protease mycosin n=1 Tax=Streptomyces longispororuber TaxID=68230 RepID=UPI00210E740D|nr:type VII secretion-associated serine protease mycosin [Streptomyces longispororuber]MCQ4210993.1 type VII secretion-associated serine protease mycosin [Streptomyces longispororuber]